MIFCLVFMTACTGATAPPQTQAPVQPTAPPANLSTIEAPTEAVLQTQPPSATPTEQPLTTSTETLSATATPAPLVLSTEAPTQAPSQAAPTEGGPPLKTQYIDCSVTSVGLTPLIDMGANDTYHGEDGGLYGNGQNQPPEGHFLKAQEATANIVPRDAQGNPSPNGKIGLVSIGMSNARIEYNVFGHMARDVKSPNVEVINAAQPGVLAWAWANNPPPKKDPWEVMASVIEQRGLTPEQVQVIWLKEAEDGPKPGVDDFPVYAERLRDDMATIVERVKQDYPNVQIVYLSSRIYAGYSLIPLSPEPFAYEGAFANRWLIQDQINGGGASGVTYENAPVLLWGPYLWADGTNPRSDGLTWNCSDFKGDGVHPDDPATQKVAQMLVDFFTSDPLARTWFTRAGNP